MFGRIYNALVSRETSQYKLCMDLNCDWCWIEFLDLINTLALYIILLGFLGNIAFVRLWFRLKFLWFQSLYIHMHSCKLACFNYIFKLISLTFVHVWYTRVFYRTTSNWWNSIENCGWMVRMELWIRGGEISFL